MNKAQRFGYKSMKMALLPFAFLIAFASVSFAEKAMEQKALNNSAPTIKGKVISQEDGEGLPGVTVVIKGTTIGTVTDIDGNYTIEIPSGQANPVLVFSSIGYISQEVAVAGRAVIDIALTYSVEQLQEVVVVGYGEQKKQSVVAAISQTKGEDLLKSGNTQSVSQALQGSMPGLTVINSDGLPGKGAHEIQIRGVSTTGNAAPLTIVDGVERSIHMIDPNEIESVSILKDASATAVYGVRGANGVIMITTKKGKSGKPEFNFSSTVTVKKPTKAHHHADYITTMEMYNEAVANDGLWDQLIPESTLNAWKENIHNAGPYNEFFPQIDWWDELVKDYGTQQQYNLNARGGTESMRYFVSAGYLTEGDIFKTNLGVTPYYTSDFGFQRYNWRSNLDFDVTKSTEFSIGFAGNMRTRTQPVFGNNLDLIFNGMWVMPTNQFPIKYSDGQWGDSEDGGDNYLSLFNEGGQERHRGYEGFYDASLKQKLDFVTKGLSVEAKLAYTSGSDYFSNIFTERSGNVNRSLTGGIRYYRKFDYTNPIEGPDGTIQYPVIAQRRYPDDVFQGGRPVQTTYSDFRGYNRNLFYQFSTNYTRKFGKHAVTGLALVNRQMEMLATWASGNVTTHFPSYREDWVSRVTYSYADKYLFEVNGAYTGSEKFDKGKRFGFFPSYSAGWVLSEESFVKNYIGSAVNFLKVRYSYGHMGSDVGAPRFAYDQIFTASGSSRFGYTNLVTYAPLYFEGKAANPNQTWEDSYKQNLGFDLDLYNKFSATLELYSEKRMGILMDLRTVPIWFGGKEPSGNIGQTKNRGYELSFGWNDKIGQDFTYYIKPYISQFENRIVFYDDPRLQDDYKKHAGKPIRWDRQAPRLLTAGYYNSLDDIYNGAPANHGLPMNQLIPGDLMFVDFNANGITDIQDEVVMEQQLYPTTLFGVNFGFAYSNLEVNALIYGVTDVNRSIVGQLYWDFDGQEIMAQPDVTTRWTPENAANAGKPALHLRNNHNKSESDYTFVDGSYVRLENVEVSYKLSPASLKNIGINRVQIYANGSDLLTWVKEDTRVDPEAFGGGSYPVTKRYNLGLRVAF